jgi:formylglycine-generating enzyme required for sulfatase activity
MEDVDCGPGFVCRAHRCELQSTQVLNCPNDMVAIENTFCMDRYEASRPDATAFTAGVDGSRAVSRAGAIPWLVDADNALAEQACNASGKRLCTASEWEFACRGPNDSTYAYGNDYEPQTCNGIDTYGRNAFHLMATGSFEDCENGWGIFDLNGNVWEHTAGGSARTVRGGAFNCSDSKTLHRCDYVPRNWSPSALGFRCCSGGSPVTPVDEDELESLEAPPESDAECLEMPDFSDFELLEVADEELDDVEELDHDSVDEESADDDQEVEEGECPSDMVYVPRQGGAFCIDRYEAAHEDSTASTPGSSSVPVSEAGRYPWMPVTLSSARAACAEAGKRLCREEEWVFACTGSDGMVYSYGDDYDPAICNGIDTFCDCEGACAEEPVCPFPFCRSVCGAAFRVMPTGAFPQCHNEWGVYDVNGNVWEIIENEQGLEVFRGGAFNCSDSQALHRCDHIGDWNPSAKGFRCCDDPMPRSGALLPEPSALPSSSEPVSRKPRPRRQLQHLLPRGKEQPSEQPLSLGVLGYVPPKASARQRARSSASRGKSALSSDDSDDAPGHPERFEPRTGIAQGACESWDCELETAQTLWNSDEPRAAVDYLKEARERWPDEAQLAIALGIAYVRAGNFPWAVRTLSAHLDERPEDCTARLWLAWAYLQMTALEEIPALLEHASCQDSTFGPRALLLRALLAHTQEDDGTARGLLEQVEQASSLSRGDAEALRALQSMLGVARPAPLSWRMQLAAGFASNALGGSPDDPNLANREPASPYGGFELRAQLDPWNTMTTRPTLELRADGQFLSAADATDSSYLELSSRLGLRFDTKDFGLALFYRPNVLFLRGGDVYEEGPLAFYTSHRSELDLELGWLLLFGGFGHRSFRQAVRTREELDLGLGAYHQLGSGFAVTWGGNYRHWFAEGPAYELDGGSLSTALDYRIPGWDWLLRGSVSVAMDVYPESSHYFADEARVDKMLRAALQLWSESWSGVQLGGSLKLAQRWSTAPNYAYFDLRPELALRWTGDFDFHAPSERADDVFVLPWSLEGKGSAERIRDIIQQDEDVQRSSSCLQN